VSLPTRTSTRSASAGRRRRRARLATTATLLGLLVAVGGVWSVVVPRAGGSAAAAAPTNGANSFSAEDVAKGAQLYSIGCASCHGAAGQGGVQEQGPSLTGVGAASVDFQVGTGRMPLKQPGAQAARAQQQYTAAEIHQLTGYVVSLGPGPEIPDVNIADGDLAYGATLFRANCASCHNFAGQGNSLSSGKYAPVIYPATNQQLGDAIRSGPESMPVFSTNQLNAHDINSIARYVTMLRTPHDPGGDNLGRLGPVPEGLVIWIVGIGALVGVALWIGDRAFF